MNTHLRVSHEICRCIFSNYNAPIRHRFPAQGQQLDCAVWHTATTGITSPLPSEATQCCYAFKVGVSLCLFIFMAYRWPKTCMSIQYKSLGIYASWRIVSQAYRHFRVAAKQTYVTKLLDIYFSKALWGEGRITFASSHLYKTAFIWKIGTNPKSFL